MIDILLILVLFYMVLASYAWAKAINTDRLYWSDIFLPFGAFVFWFVLTSLGFGHQSLAHLFELPIILIFSLIILYLRVFIFDKYKKNYRLNSYLTVCMGLIFVFLLRTFMPYLPE